MEAPFVVEITGRDPYEVETMVEAVAWAAAFCPVGGGVYVHREREPIFGCYRESGRTVWTLLGFAPLWDAFRMLPAGNTLTADSIKPAACDEAAHCRCEA